MTYVEQQARIDDLFAAISPSERDRLLDFFGYWATHERPLPPKPIKRKSGGVGPVGDYELNQQTKAVGK